MNLQTITHNDKVKKYFLKIHTFLKNQKLKSLTCKGFIMWFNLFILFIFVFVFIV